MSFFSKILNFFSPQEKKSAARVSVKKILRENSVRTRDGKGRFIPDDPATEENEAWALRKK